MPVRLRRARLTFIVIVFLFFVVLYVHREPTEIADDHPAGTIGGGAVLRVEPDKGRAGAVETTRAASAASVKTATRAKVSPTKHTKSDSHATPTRYTTPKHEAHPSIVTHSMSWAVAPTPTPVIAHNPYFHAGQELELPIPADQGRVEVATQVEVIHWSKQSEHFPVSSTIALPKGTPKSIPRIQFHGDGPAEEDRLRMVREEMQHAWGAYSQYAGGADEIEPVTGGTKNPFNGWGATLVDTMDTLWIMGMKAEFEAAVEAVAKIDFTTSSRADIPLFETTIRYVGGLLGAFDVSGGTYKVLLDKAVELAEVLFGAFDTPNRMPQTYYQWKPAFASQPHRATSRTIMSELGSLSMEFTRLAQIVNDSKYYDAVARITDALQEMQNRTLLPGMWPLTIDASGCRIPPSGWSAGDYMVSGTGGDETDAAIPFSLEGKPEPQHTPIPAQPSTGDLASVDHSTNDGNIRVEKRTSTANGANTHNGSNGASLPDPCLPQGLQSLGEFGPDTFSLSGMSDSTYEYFPKQYLLLGGNVEQYKSMYLASAHAITSELLFRPMTVEEHDILLSGQVTISKNRVTDELRKDYRANGEHLSCFAGGMFALAGKLFNRPEDVTIGSKLTEGCVWAYNATATGIMPESFLAVACEHAEHCPWNQTEYWRLLDPSMEYRLHPAGLYPLQQPHHMPPVEAPPSGLQNHHRNTSSGHQANLEKRQLAESDVGTQTHPPSRFDVPTVPQPPGFNQAPAYAAPTPLSHEDFVRSRIADERLPSGMLSLVSREYHLRPEAIESVFYMYRVTGDRHWRDVGWNMFNAIKQHTREQFGHSAIDDVTREIPTHTNKMESFWTAETLKYFYLLFDDKDAWSLDDWVFNTEAHLFRLPR